jgi:hypothetical protein
MKTITGYLIDRETGLGISGKAVAFNNLAGSPITTATTYAQSVSSTTDADGKFSGWFELSPGPVDVLVTVAADEKKVRKHDETAQIGASWLSDLQRIGWAFRDGVLPGFLNQLAVTTPSGHNIVIATGGAIIDGILFSIENGPMTIAGTANSNPALNPRYDLVTLRQYKATATGQDAGRQAVIVTLGTSQAVVPATPTGADFTDYPLGVVSTAYNAATKSVYRDLRAYTQNPVPESEKHNIVTVVAQTITTSYVTIATPSISNLSPGDIYDGNVTLQGYMSFNDVSQTFDNTEMHNGALNNKQLFVAGWELDSSNGRYWLHVPIAFSWPISGVTGVTSYGVPIQLRNSGLNAAGTLTIPTMDAHLTLRKRV